LAIGLLTPGNSDIYFHMPWSHRPRFPRLLAVEIVGLCAIAIAVAIIDDYQTLAIRDDTAQIASDVTATDTVQPEKGGANIDTAPPPSRPDNNAEITRRPHPMRSARSTQSPGKHKAQRDRMTII
jgi:hypothetical protein